MTVLLLNVPGMIKVYNIYIYIYIPVLIEVRMEVMCNMSIVQMFEEMGNFIQLEEPDIEIQERVIVKKRILGVLKQMLTSCDSESIGNLCLEGYTKGFIYLIQIAAQTDDLEFIDVSLKYTTKCR